jgi:hypothetical protein
MAEVSFAVSTVGLIIPFALTDPVDSATGTASPISNAIAITTAVWVSQSGKRRALVLSQPTSATFTYQISAADSRMPHIEEGYLEVVFADHIFFTETFRVNCYQHF